jgi:hypothetical protein
LLHPASVETLPVSDEDNLKTTPAEQEHMGSTQKMKGEIKIIEGKALRSQQMIDEGMVIKHGVPFEK